MDVLLSLIKIYNISPPKEPSPASVHWGNAPTRQCLTALHHTFGTYCMYTGWLAA